MTSIVKDNEEEEEKSMKLAMDSLSNRGQHATIPATSYFLDYLKAISSKFHPTNNPDGYIPLCVAENKLCEEELKELFVKGEIDEDEYLIVRKRILINFE